MAAIQCKHAFGANAVPLDHDINLCKREKKQSATHSGNKITILGEVPGKALGLVWEAVQFLAV